MKLKLCPLCGGKAQSNQATGQPKLYGDRFYCRDCSFSASLLDWNRRPEPPKPLTVEELREMDPKEYVYEIREPGPWSPLLENWRAGDAAMLASNTSGRGVFSDVYTRANALRWLLAQEGV